MGQPEEAGEVGEDEGAEGGPDRVLGPQARPRAEAVVEPVDGDYEGDAIRGPIPLKRHEERREERQSPADPARPPALEVAVQRGQTPREAARAVVRHVGEAVVDGHQQVERADDGRRRITPVPADEHEEHQQRQDAVHRRHEPHARLPIAEERHRGRGVGVERQRGAGVELVGLGEPVAGGVLRGENQAPAQ